MESAFSFTLLGLLVFQCIFTFLLLGPRVLAQPVISLYKLSRGSPASSSVAYTIGFALAALAGTSSIELFTNRPRKLSGDVQGGLMATIDLHRAWLATILSAINLVLLFSNRAFAEEKFQHDKAKLNLQTMLKQVQGLQTEYSRATADISKPEHSDDAGEATALKKQLQRLKGDTLALQEEVEAASQAKATAESRLAAMISQVKGMDKEYDRLLAENEGLRNRLATYDKSFAKQSKKDS